MNKKVIFKTKNELIEALLWYDESNDEIIEFVEFIKSCENLGQVFATCPTNLRVFAIKQGFVQFTKDCNFDELDREDWVRILKFHPEYITAVDDLNIFEGRDWAKMISFQPEFLFEYCPMWKLDNTDLTIILVSQPQLSEHFSDYSLLTGKNWTSILTSSVVRERGFEEKFLRLCNWNKLTGENWAYLLSERPEFADRCDWSKLSEKDWEYLLKWRPELKKYKIEKELSK